MRATPRPACTNTASSTATVNHHSARRRSAGRRWGPSAPTPARPLPMIMNHAQPAWMSRRVRGPSRLRPGRARGQARPGLSREGPLTLRDIHAGWAWFMIIGNGLAGVGALGPHRLPALRRRALWWFTVAVELAVFVQAGLGVALMTAEEIDPPQFHLLYGFSGLITVGIVYSYRDSLEGKLYLLYGFGG